VDATDVEALAAAMRPQTALVWVETPSNPLLSIVDIARAAAIAHAHGARLVVENTLGTPVLQRPFEFGADLVVHSTTKFLGGHSDVLGGVVITKVVDEFFQRLRRIQIIGGAVPSPFDCWLLQRSLKTLACRVRTQSETALKVARFLATHKRVERVLYPGLPEHPGYLTAKRQMSGFGGVISFTLKEGAAAAKALLMLQALVAWKALSSTVLQPRDLAHAHRRTWSGYPLDWNIPTISLLTYPRPWVRCHSPSQSLCFRVGDSFAHQDHGS
jgi:cystathionine gamma-synthase